MSVFIAQSDGDKLTFKSEYHRNQFKAWIRQIKGKWVRLELAKNPVSDRMRGYYFGAIIPTIKGAVEQWEHLSNDDVHEILKKMFNGFDFYNPSTKQNERVGRSAMGADSNTKRAMEYIEKIGVWMGEEFHIELPSPEEWKINVRDNPELL